MTEHWFRFSAFNSNALYGWGTTEEAKQYCERLNVGREINRYHPVLVRAHEAQDLDLENDTEAFNIGDALSADQD